MKIKICNLLYYHLYFSLDALEFYFLSTLLLVGGLSLFLAGAMEPRPDLFYPKIIATAIGVVLLFIAIHKHIREGL